MPEVIISFDTEDFATPQAWDAQLWWADELSARGITGQFQCVAQLIRTLKRRGRDDVLAAFARHDVGYHTKDHSVPPVHPAGVAGKSLVDGIAWILRREADGFAEIVSTFSRVPVSFAAPGRAWTAPTLLAMAMLGIRTWCNPTFLLQRGRPTWYCGLMAFQYDMAFDNYFDPGSSDAGPADSQADRFLQQFDAYAREADAAAEHAAAGVGVLTLYSHPTRLVTSAFWDRPYFGGADVPMDKLPPAPLRPPAQVQQLKDRVGRILDALQARSNVRFTTYAAAYAQRTRRPEDRRDLPALLAECGLQPGQEGDLPLAASQRAATVRERSSSTDQSPLDLALAPDALWTNAAPYKWGVIPPDADRQALIEQARQLAWTGRLSAKDSG